MTRYLSTEELNSALVELEENEHVASAERGGSERHSDSEPQTKQSESGSFDANGKSSANRPEENGRDYEVAADSESYSDSVSIYRDGHEDEDFLFEEKSDDRPENEVDNDDDDMPFRGSETALNESPLT